MSGHVSTSGTDSHGNPGQPPLGGMTPEQAFRAFRQAVDEFGAATSRELERQNRLHRAAWAAFFAIPLGIIGSNLVALAVVTPPSPGNLRGIGLALGLTLWAAVAVVLVLALRPRPWRWTRGRTLDRPQAAGAVPPPGLQRATEELVRIQVEVDRMRRRASDTTLLIAILLIIMGGFASNLVSAAFPTLSFPVALFLSDGVFGALAILWAALYWGATQRRVRRMESRAVAVRQGLTELEEALWSRF